MEKGWTSARGGHPATGNVTAMDVFLERKDFFLLRLIAIKQDKIINGFLIYFKLMDSGENK